MSCSAHSKSVTLGCLRSDYAQNVMQNYSSKLRLHQAAREGTLHLQQMGGVVGAEEGVLGLKKAVCNE